MKQCLWLICAITLQLTLGCGEDEGEEGSSSDGTGSAPGGTEDTMTTMASDDDRGSGGGTTEDDTGSATGGTSGSVCYPEGIYGKCSENSGCFCLQGATVYQVCSSECTTAEDCGDPADFPGAVPGCYPLNPGSEQMICALVCQTDEDCPCGLICTDSGVEGTKICAELQ